MGTLLSAIVLWLSAMFGLPANFEHPRVAFVSEAAMSALYYRGLAGPRGAADPAAAPDSALTPDRAAASGFARKPPRTLVAFYDDRTHTIYLREGWTGATPAEISVLVHEMVHHLQNLARSKYACPYEREALAYRAQDRWLRLFGGSLERDFEVDPFTLLAMTNCAP